MIPLTTWQHFYLSSTVYTSCVCLLPYACLPCDTYLHDISSENEWRDFFRIPISYLSYLQYLFLPPNAVSTTLESCTIHHYAAFCCSAESIM